MIEKVEKSRIIVEKTFYYSDDGLMKSEDKEAILNYEKNLFELRASRLYTTDSESELLGTELSNWEIYRCDSRGEFLKTIKGICAKKRTPREDKLTAKTAYIPECHFYAIRQEEGWNSKSYDLEVKPMDELISEYEEELVQCDIYRNSLATEVQALKYLKR